MEFVLVVLLLLLIAAGIYVAVRHSLGEREEPKLPYKLKKYFFTRSEREFFRELNKQLDKDRHAVFPKVRLGDFMEVDLPKGKRMPYWNRIRSRHVDFLIWDLENSAVAAAIEVDGNSHNSAKAQENDGFKDELYRSVGLPLFRIQVGNDFKSEIALMLDQIEGISSENFKSSKPNLVD